MSLDRFIGQLFRKLQRTRHARSAHRVVTAFVAQDDDVVLIQPAAIEVRSPPFPAYWADSEGSWDSSSNVLWDEAQYDVSEGTGRWDDGVSKWDDGVTRWG